MSRHVRREDDAFALGDVEVKDVEGNPNSLCATTEVEPAVTDAPPAPLSLPPMVMRSNSLVLHANTRSMLKRMRVFSLLETQTRTRLMGHIAGRGSRNCDDDAIIASDNRASLLVISVDEASVGVVEFDVPLADAPATAAASA